MIRSVVKHIAWIVGAVVGVRLLLLLLCLLNGKLPYALDAADRWPTSPDGFKYRLIDDRFVDPFIRWDATAYLSIAHEGYKVELDRPSNTAFFPGYPIIFRTVHDLLAAPLFPGPPGDLRFAVMRGLSTALGVNVVLFLAGLLLFYVWAGARYDAAIAFRAALLMAVGPTSFLFFCPLSEAAFFCFAVAAFLAADRGYLRTAAVFVGLLSLTRPTGVLALLPIFLIGCSRREGEPERPIGWWASMAAAPFGVLVVCLLMAEKTGTIGAYALQQSVFFGHNAFPTTSGIVDFFRFAEHGRGRIARDLLQIVALFSATVAVFLLVRRRRKSLRELAPAVFVAVMLIVPALSGEVVSLARYATALFPIFLAFGKVIERPRTTAIVVATSIVLQSFFFLSWMHAWGIVI